jgi:hypothetical protein
MGFCFLFFGFGIERMLTESFRFSGRLIEGEKIRSVNEKQGDFRSIENPKSKFHNL